MKKNLFLTFCFSFIPGAGQMYQSYMKRGLSIMLIFALFSFLSVAIAPIFSIIMPVIYAYAFFDTYNIRNRIGTEDQAEDEYIWYTMGFDKLVEINKGKRNLFVGILFLILGVYLLFNNVIGDLSYRSNIVWLETLVSTIKNYLPPILIGAVSIGVGIKLITNNNKEELK